MGGGRGGQGGRAGAGGGRERVRYRNTGTKYTRVYSLNVFGQAVTPLHASCHSCVKDIAYIVHEKMNKKKMTRN